MTTRLRRIAAFGVALLVSGGTAACTGQHDPAPSPASAAGEETVSPDPDPTTTDPTAEPTSPATLVPYDPQSDYADATLEELRDYVTANDELLEAAIPSFEMQAGASPDAATQDLLDRAREIAAAVDPSIDLSDDELRPMLDAQEQILADMAG